MGGQSKLLDQEDEGKVNRFSPENQVPMWVEAVIVGGLGLVIYVGPPVVRVLRDRVRPCVQRVCGSFKRDILLRLEPFNRKRKNGSIIRVVASLLPDFCFEPASRIYIPSSMLNSATEQRRMEYMYGEDNTVLAMAVKDDLSLTEDGGVIVAFELETESSGGDVDEWDDVCSNPDGRENPDFTVPTFYPGESTYRACSTPNRGRNKINESISPPGEEALQNNPEIAELKMMVQQLIRVQMTSITQNASMNFNHNQSTQNFNHVENVRDSIPVVPVVATAKLTNIPGPPPHPPPPPPMPMMPLIGSQKLVINRKVQQDSTPKKATPSLLDVLKELPNAKLGLRKIDRSPGGTPIKRKKRISMENKERMDMGHQLASALKKRFESMHSPTRDDENGNADKENQGGSVFEDSFEQSFAPFKKTLNLKF